jgi:hypothetical protein
MANFRAKVCSKMLLAQYNTEGTVFFTHGKFWIHQVDPPKMITTGPMHLLMHLRNERTVGNLGTIHGDTVSALALWDRRSSS